MQIKAFNKFKAPKQAKLVELFARNQGYEDKVEQPAQVDDPANLGQKKTVMQLVANPETKEDFAKRLAFEWITAQALAQQRRDKSLEADQLLSDD